MAKKVTMDDIAQKLGISKNTVSLAFRGMPGISRQTRELIHETGRELGYSYKSNSIEADEASYANHNNAQNICLILPKSTRGSRGFFINIQIGIEDEARLKGFNTIIHYLDDESKEFAVPLSIKAGIIAGIIALGNISYEHTQAILNLKLPLVMVDNYFDSMKLDYILTDNICGAFAAVEHLIERNHKSIGFCGDIRASVGFYDRYQGYMKALHHYELTAEATYVLNEISMEKAVEQNFTLAVEAIRSIPKLPTAFFCSNDADAIALLKVLAYLDIKVPRDISVMGFDNIESSKNVIPELTTIHVEKEYMGKMSVDKLFSIIQNRNSIPEKLLISTNLVERRSIGNGGHYAS
jgi:LacI family transcriptional regulator